MDILLTSSIGKAATSGLPAANGITDGSEVAFKISLIADGCVIEGSVENCVLFRGVRIGKDAVVKNSVLMQGTHVGEKCNIERVIADKNVDISSDKVLTGSDDFPLYLSKNGKI